VNVAIHKVKTDAVVKISDGKEEKANIKNWESYILREKKNNWAK
jgi:hypothetical protein